mmetsp:Transcript_10516/g.25402  ORF Transcript_10516/g.25402 Transcript_10516/m.25402 type:complete len:123 (+) Transcript_10516:56-424(+)
MPPKKKNPAVEEDLGMMRAARFGRVKNTLTMGFVGLPNVGKSSLTNLLSGAAHAEAANYVRFGCHGCLDHIDYHNSHHLSSFRYFNSLSVPLTLMLSNVLFQIRTSNTLQIPGSHHQLSQLP